MWSPVQSCKKTVRVYIRRQVAIGMRARMDAQPTSMTRRRCMRL
jgi:hypothetical protein